MKRFPYDSISDDLLRIWFAGSSGADAKTLVNSSVTVDGNDLNIAGQRVKLDSFERIRVVGAGKAADAMASGLEASLGPSVMCDKAVRGWVNVPCEADEQAEKNNAMRRAVLAPRSTIWRFGARPLADNLPTNDCYAGTLLIGDIVQSTSEREICICLVSGGGSALMAQPVGDVSIADKRTLISFLGSQACSIRELNTVRKHISGVKGGRLAAKFHGRHLYALMISDVLGDEIGLIASGPTVQDSSTPAEAMDILKAKDPKLKNIPNSIVRHLTRTTQERVVVPENVSNVIVGNVNSAVDASVDIARELGYRPQAEIQLDEFETADQCGRRMAEWVMENVGTRSALVSGGEPVVQLCARPGRGGRNLQLVLAALDHLLKSGRESSPTELEPFALVSGGTDGQDGNTSSAGAWLTHRSVQLARQRNLDPGPYLRKNDAYSFFSKNDCFDLLTMDSNSTQGSAAPVTQTNVGDLRVCLTGADLKS